MYDFVNYICHCNFIMMILIRKCHWEICCPWLHRKLSKSQHNSDAIMSARPSQITSLTSVYSRRRTKKTSKPRVTGLCEGNSPVTGEFPAQKASNAENVIVDDVVNFEVLESFVKMTIPLQWNLLVIFFWAKSKVNLCIWNPMVQ